MTETALIATPTGAVETTLRLPPVPWRDPHSVDPEQLREHIAILEKRCAGDPGNAGLRTCLGMAHAMNHDVYKCMDALEEARRAEPDHFFAQMKYAELFYRLRALHRAEEETKRALDLAMSPWELSVARKQLAEIRKLKREGTQKPAWTRSLTSPSVMLVLMVVASVVLLLWR